jgi:hypothetical protein
MATLSSDDLDAAIATLNACGIRGEDATTALALVFQIADNATYAKWLSDIRCQINESVSTEVRDDRLAAQYGHDAIRAILALANPSEVQS